MFYPGGESAPLPPATWRRQPPHAAGGGSRVGRGLAQKTGIEPASACLTGTCSSYLSYFCMEWRKAGDSNPHAPEREPGFKAGAIPFRSAFRGGAADRGRTCIPSRS